MQSQLHHNEFIVAMTPTCTKTISFKHAHLKELSSRFRVDVVSLEGGVALLPEVEPGLLVLPVAGLADLPQVVLHLYVRGEDSYESLQRL